MQFTERFQQRIGPAIALALVTATDLLAQAPPVAPPAGTSRG